MNYKWYFSVYTTEPDQSRSRSKVHNAKLDKIKGDQTWPAKCVI